MKAALATFCLACAVWIAAPGSFAQAPIAKVQLDPGADGLRMLITFDRPVSYTILDLDDMIEVSFDEPVAFEPSSQQISGSAISGFRVAGDRRLLLEKAADFFSYDPFELSNPARLIIDLKSRSVGQVPGAVLDGSLANTRPTAEWVIVIDPGHGGVEKGAAGPTGLREKDVTLDLAQRLKRRIQNRSDVAVVLTRDEDKLVPHDERTAVANHNRADLFMSIHLNASPRRSAKGAETYYLATSATDDEARELAALENQMGTGDAFEQPELEGLDMVLWDLAQNRHMDASSRLAERVQRELNVLTGTRNRGVKQAPFRVLMGATMPAVLVEVGFISNAQEEALFKTDEYRSKVVDALANAVEAYLAELRQLARPSSNFGGAQE